MTTNLETEAGKVRLSAKKTKVMLVGEVEVLQPITVHGQNVDHVDRFTYLGSILTCDSDAEADVNCRIGKAVSVFQRMRSIWSLSLISTDTKIWLYKAIVMSVGIFASETWKITTKNVQKLNVFHQRCLRKILHVTCREHVTNEEVLMRTGSRKLAYTVTECSFLLTGHILRLPSHRPSKVAISWTPDDGKRRGCPKKTWRRTFQEDLTRANISWKEAEHTAMDRPLWRQAAAQCPTGTGGNMSK